MDRNDILQFGYHHSSFKGMHPHWFDDLDYFFMATTCEPNIGACDDAEIVADICAQA